MSLHAPTWCLIHILLKITTGSRYVAARSYLVLHTHHLVLLHSPAPSLHRPPGAPPPPLGKVQRPNSLSAHGRELGEALV